MAHDASKSPARLVVLASEAALARQLAAEFDPNASLQVVATVSQALMALRNESCDAVIARHEPPRVDAVVLACALRGAGEETSMAILGVDEATAHEAGADVGCPDGGSDWVARLQRAILERVEQRAERFALVAEQQRLARAKAVVENLTTDQHEMLAVLRDVAGPDVQRYVAADDGAPASPTQETPAARAA